MRGEKKDRRLKRLKRKVREAELRVNKRIHERITELRSDVSFMRQIDVELQDVVNHKTAQQYIDKQCSVLRRNTAS